jgi:hypothetical protein
MSMSFATVGHTIGNAGSVARGWQPEGWKAQCLLDLHATHWPLKRQHEPLDFPGNFPGNFPGDFWGGEHRVFG